ncbi:hypothetical protein OESDEN_04991 [Oesophagostomum dentatum]|uniref:Uncharacterized protein n=1 Tax=Oesophagostomum dentatum TaxID=61180 RepID=A0A0B1TGY1_OESDE|nr:hypothetical protein OESDEN_04991 [Oesophagostomum dentatum]
MTNSNRFSPRKDYFSQADRITYPTVSGGSQHASSAPQFGQSYSAFFAEEPYGQKMDYGDALRSHQSTSSFGGRNFRR